MVSAGFSSYASALGAYSRLYGSLAGVVVFLVWLWLSNLALLTGAQFAAELGGDRDEHLAGDEGSTCMSPSS